ncbi:MAG: pentapeptide repeat-containing protein [bacterium]|nr:pentapeptide repeat-containing protein [bacterium]
MNKLFLFILLLASTLMVGCNNDADKLTATNNCPGCDLTNSYFKNAKLPGADFSKAKMLGMTLEGSVLTNANFEEAFLFNANLMNSDVSGANFKNASLMTANLRNAKIDGANFEGADLSGAVWLQGFRCQSGSIGVCYKTAREKVEATGNCAGCNFFSKDLSGHIFEGGNFEKAIFHETNLQDVQFKNANLKGATFKDANIMGATFEGSELMGAVWVDGSECGDGSIGKCVPH